MHGHDARYIASACRRSYCFVERVAGDMSGLVMWRRKDPRRASVSNSVFSEAYDHIGRYGDGSRLSSFSFMHRHCFRYGCRTQIDYI